MNNAPNAIEVRDVTKVYKSGSLEVQALRGVSFTIARGEYVAIMGPSGSGKSTLMNVLGCLDRATTGTYLLDGVDVSGLDDNDAVRGPSPACRSTRGSPPRCRTDRGRSTAC